MDHWGPWEDSFGDLKGPPQKTHTLELQMENANLSSTTDESRVQPKSFEYDESRLARH